MAERAVVALGSNLGDPLAHLRAARLQLSSLGTIEAASSLYLTVPVGGPAGQPDYLNAVIVLLPAPVYRSPSALLWALLEIERRRGRRRRLNWEARTLDLDLLAFGDRVMSEPGLVIPHPRMLERPFVLAPLCEACDSWRHPLTGRSACEELAELPDTGVERTRYEWVAE